MRKPNVARCLECHQQLPKPKTVKPIRFCRDPKPCRRRFYARKYKRWAKAHRSVLEGDPRAS